MHGFFASSVTFMYHSFAVCLFFFCLLVCLFVVFCVELMEHNYKACFIIVQRSCMVSFKPMPFADTVMIQVNFRPFYYRKPRPPLLLTVY